MCLQGCGLVEVRQAESFAFVVGSFIESLSNATLLEDFGTPTTWRFMGLSSQGFKWPNWGYD